MSQLLLIAAAGAFLAQPASAFDVKLEPIATAMQSPVDLKESPDGSGRLFIVEQTGNIRIVMPDGSMKPEPFLDLSRAIVKMYVRFDERGVLGLAFHPDYKNNGKFYVHYSVAIPENDPDLLHEIFGNHTSIVSEFKVSDNADVADAASERVLMRVNQPQFNHNGGALEFGPDGHLYISLGDGGFADDWGYGHNKKIGNSQDLSNLLGKVLRIDVNKQDEGLEYGIPSDNPFANKDGARAEIFAYGFRNPWRMTFDTGGDHSLFVADVQQNSYEEVNIVKNGGNYGWRIMEGNHCFDYLNPNDAPASCDKTGLEAPIIEYNHCNKHAGKDCLGVNVQGGAVYRGNHAAWQGKYFFGDWSMTFGGKSGRLYAATESGGKWTIESLNVTNGPFVTHVLAITQDLSGNVYIMTSDSMGPYGSRDTVYKVVP
jgi:glucose/arabinose dehydrogenase